ncbi:MAG TPA: class I SAM-dependent methyltransferase [Solirubrobacteraceae bacterium]|jgi:SAM-dependent methyltransferase|nr:class I SAM-dependent methyltransferase [Solirubrobacteraceae bacterium]
MESGAQSRLNAEHWQAGTHVGAYAHRRLHPVEVLLLERYRDALSGRVLEVGCGAGRVLGYLVELGGEVHGIDISPAMVAHCQAAYPQAAVRVGDLAAISASTEGKFDAVLGVDSVLDVFDDGERRRVLSDLRALLAPGGLLIFSSHNLARSDGSAPAPGIDAEAGPGAGGEPRLRPLVRRALSKPPIELLTAIARMPRAALARRRNRRRMAALESRGPDYAIINDLAHDYALLHYYIGRDAQQRQLEALAYELVECLDPRGRTVGAGEAGDGPWLFYVARWATSGAA